LLKIILYLAVWEPVKNIRGRNTNQGLILLEVYLNVSQKKIIDPNVQTKQPYKYILYTHINKKK